MSISASICLPASKALVSTTRTQLTRASVTMDTMVSTAHRLFSVFSKISSVRTEEPVSTATVYFICLIFYLILCFKISVFFQDSWSCDCTDNYSGDLCESSDVCASAQCDVTGTSVCEPINDEDYNCVCFESFSGDFCDVGPCDVTENPPCDPTGEQALALKYGIFAL